MNDTVATSFGNIAVHQIKKKNYLILLWPCTHISSLKKNVSLSFSPLSLTLFHFFETGITNIFVKTNTHIHFPMSIQ